MTGDKISYLDLIKHALLDSFEFSVHAENEALGVYTLNGIGVDFFVGFDEESVFTTLKSSGCKKAFFAHTHPLINDNSLRFQKGKADPRKLIAFGQKILPLGNCPSQGDLKYFSELKQTAKKYGVEIAGVVFSARGIWIFSAKGDVDFKEEGTEYKKGHGDFFENLEIRGKYPSYLMEVQQPKIRTQLEYASGIPKNIFRELLVKMAEPFYQLFLKIKVQKIIKSFSKQGVCLEYVDHKSKNIDPVFLLKSGIERWERLH